MWEVESHAEVAAKAPSVWSFYVEPSTWSAWAHSTASAAADLPLRVGSVVTVVPTNGPAQRVRVVVLEPERRLVTQLRLPGAVMSFHYEVESVPGGSAVTHRVRMDGPLAAMYGLAIRERNRDKLALETERLSAAVLARD